MPSWPNMVSLPVDQTPSHRRSPEPSQNPTSCHDAPSITQNCRHSCPDTSTNDNIKRLDFSVALAGDWKDRIPRRLPETPSYAKTKSHDSKPVDANQNFLTCLSSNISALTLNPDSSHPPGHRSDVELSISLAVHEKACFTTDQLGDAGGTVDSSRAEHDNQPSNSMTKLAITTRATKRMKRKRNSTADDDQEEDEEGDGDDRRCSDGKETPSSNRPMACPYRKWDKKKFNYHEYPKCTKSFRDLTDVKQHIKKEHVLAPSELPSHRRQGFENGINQYVVDQLRDRKDRTKIHEWPRLWVFLFNDDTNIPSSDYEPCQVFESNEVTDMMNQLAGHFGPPNVGTDTAIRNIQSAYLTNRNTVTHVTGAPKRKKDGRQKARHLNTGAQGTQQVTSLANDRYRKLAPRAADDNTPARSEDFTTASSIMSSRASPVRRSARLTSQPAHSVYPPVPEPWDSLQHFPEYGADSGWTSNARGIDQDMTENGNQV
ncbi:uncharacterized protein QC763_206995 [Podospora pseudopauciseta]|uniref:C2H2-type domain-containing protein n=1 Tax=Podospora pseudopauciseta TaxID=2093780 RepID=A0ABR0HPP7_9PEZI|nr:hypothetical protein QC763_206995 [Podospora pseudopauciseta]